MPLRLTKAQVKAYGIRVSRAPRLRSARRPDGYASQLEADYAHVLQQQVLAGTLVRWVYEPWQFVLVPGAKPVRYKPDFLAIPPRGKWTIFECKGLWRPKDRVVIKLCAHAWPELHVIGVTRVRGVWQFEAFS